jgi:hypothetical protein
MTGSDNSVVPKARKENLLVRKLETETVVYDRLRDKAYCLNGMVASVWDACDGRRTVEQISVLLGKAINPSVDNRIVWLAVKQLDKYSLLEKVPGGRFQVPAVSRRDLIRLGLYSTIALPVITAISAPTATQAASAISRDLCKARTQGPAGLGCLGTPCEEKAAPNTFCQPSGGDKCDCKSLLR